MKHITFIGEQIRNLREKSLLTQREVALELCMDASLLAKIERGERYPTKQQLKRIAEFFKVEETSLQLELLSDQIAYKILAEEVDLKILKVAEEKVNYLKTKK